MTGGLLDRVGPRPIIVVGFVLTAIGTIPFTGADQHTSTLVLGCALVVRGAGLGAVFMAVMLGAYADLSKAQIPDASSATRIMQQIGGSFGTAVLAVILQRQLATHPGAAGHATAFDNTFGWALAFTILGIGVALLLPRRPLTAPTAAVRQS